MKKLLAALTAGLLAAGAYAQAPTAPLDASAPALSSMAPQAKSSKASKGHKSGHKKVAKKHAAKSAKHATS